KNPSNRVSGYTIHSPANPEDVPQIPVRAKTPQRGFEPSSRPPSWRELLGGLKPLLRPEVVNLGELALPAWKEPEPRVSGAARASRGLSSRSWSGGRTRRRSGRGGTRRRSAAGRSCQMSICGGDEADLADAAEGMTLGRSHLPHKS